MSGHNFVALKEAILAASVAKNWTAARAEWTVAAIYMSKEWGACVCGNQIKEHCDIVNTRNHNQLTVGNVCVKHFGCQGADTAPTAMAGLRRIIMKPTAAANPALTEFAWNRCAISGGDFTFLKETTRLRSLSAQQSHRRVSINRKLVRELSPDALAMFDRNAEDQQPQQVVVPFSNYLKVCR